ncbi:MAG: hypothetical protein ACREVY_06120 [Gammaproteobacteria bacterium]
MNAADIIAEVHAADGQIAVDDTGLVLTADHPLSADLLDRLKAHKPAILAFLAEAEDLREHFEERAGILEYDAGLPRLEAELEAARITSTYARNKAYLWASLRSALADYPALFSRLPGKPGPVDALPFGVAKVAVLSGRRVVRQGAFTGAHGVKA